MIFDRIAPPICIESFGELKVKLLHENAQHHLHFHARKMAANTVCRAVREWYERVSVEDEPAFGVFGFRCVW